MRDYICTYGEGCRAYCDGQCNNINEMCGYRVKIVTNADYIRNMDNDELAALFNSWVDTGACNDFGIEHSRKCDSNCLECIKEWLNSPKDNT